MSDPQVIAHRGGAGVWPENTLTAFLGASRAGCVIETDVRLTADGVAVCFHDASVAAPTGGARRVAGMRASDLRARCRAAERPLVTVADLLDGVPGARLVLDVKDPAVVDVLAHDLRRAGATGRVVATGCLDAGLARLRHAAGPDLVTGLGWWSVAALAAGAPLRPRPGVRWAFLPARLATPRTVARARALGLEVAVWTVDEPAAAQRFVALGATAVTTDRPDRLLPVLRPGAAVTVAAVGPRREVVR